jgi:hypothetical protein
MSFNATLTQNKLLVKKELELLEVDVVVTWEGSLGGNCTTNVNNNGSKNGS